MISLGGENWLFLPVTLRRDAGGEGRAEGKKPGVGESAWKPSVQEGGGRRVPGQLGLQSKQTTLSNVPVGEKKRMRY